MSFCVDVDPANPGQFFGCCGLLELASRLTGVARGSFGDRRFEVEAGCGLGELLLALVRSPRHSVDPDDETASPLRLGPPFSLLLDWWKDLHTGGRDFKLWAGKMRAPAIAHAMIAALADPAYHGDRLFVPGQVVFDPDQPSKKVEPFYFDARRASNAHARDIGFSPNDLGLTTTAFPATEALCFIGLQRFRPAPTRSRRVYEYATWPVPFSPMTAAAVASLAVPVPGARIYRFECWYRTGHKKHKAFRPAMQVSRGAA